MRKILFAAMLLLGACGAWAGSFDTYVNRTVWIEAESDGGIFDTVMIPHVVAIARYDDGKIRIYVDKGYLFGHRTYNYAAIIKEEGL
jgi:hypothetical protein